MLFLAHVSSESLSAPATMGGPFTPYANPAEFPPLVEDKEQQNEKARHVDENGRTRSESIVHFNEGFDGVCLWASSSSLLGAPLSHLLILS